MGFIVLVLARFSYLFDVDNPTLLLAMQPKGTNYCDGGLPDPMSRTHAFKWDSGGLDAVPVPYGANQRGLPRLAQTHQAPLPA